MNIDATDGMFAGKRNPLQDTIFFYDGQEGSHREGLRRIDDFDREGEAFDDSESGCAIKE